MNLKAAFLVIVLSLLAAVIYDQHHRIQNLEQLLGRENVRTILPFHTASAYCDGGSLPAHVPLSFTGMTGSEICRRDGREDNQKQNRHVICSSVKHIVIQNDNFVVGHDQRGDENCDTPIFDAWPWGRS